MIFLERMNCLAILLAFFTACTNGSSEVPGHESAYEKEKDDNWFYDEKKLSLGDSLHIRIVSWGEEARGGYLVLLADSVNSHYVGSSFFRQGTLVDGWVGDLDKDGMPEVGVVLQDTGEFRYGRLFIHELASDFTLQSFTFPTFLEAIGADYGGNDIIYKRDSVTIVREFHLLDRLDTLPDRIDKRRLFYTMENNQLVVSGVEELPAELD